MQEVPILLRLAMVREMFVKISAQSSLWRISNVQIGGRREARKELFKHFLCNFCRCPILSFPFTCTSVPLLFHILDAHICYMCEEMKNETHVFSFYTSHRLPIQILHTIQDKMGKNRRLLKINSEVRELQWGSDSLLSFSIMASILVVLIEFQIHSYFTFYIIYFILLKYSTN